MKKNGYVVRLFCLGMALSMGLIDEASAEIEARDVIYPILYSPVIGVMVYFSPVVVPIMALRTYKDEKYESMFPDDFELEAKAGYGFFPNPVHFHAEGSGDFAVSVFYRYAGLSYEALPALGQHRWELNLTPLRQWHKGDRSEVRGHLLIGGFEADGYARDMTYGYKIEYKAARYELNLATRGHTSNRDGSVAAQYKRKFFKTWQWYLQAENRIGKREGDTEGQRDSGRRMQSQYESIRFSSGFEYVFKS